MREWIGRLAEGLLGRPLGPWARRDAGGFFSRQARWALAGAGIVVVLAAALSALHAHSQTLAATTTAAHTGKTGSAVGASAQHSAPSAPYGPLVSRGKPVFCSPSDFNAGGQNALTSGKYGDYSFWRVGVNDLPSWCAIHLGEGPSRLLVAWSSDYIFDYITPDGMSPRDYTLSVSGDSTDGSDGHWRTAVSVTGNETRVREAVMPFAGMSWVKMTVTRGQAHATQPYVTIDQIDCYDVSAGLDDTALFSGDSITVMAYNRFDGSHPTFDELMHQMDPALYPVMLDEGFGGWSSSGAVPQISTWLALNPDIHYWLLGWGTNDALNMLDPAVFHDNMQQLIDAIKAAGHVPVLARIPAMNLPGARGAATDAEIRALNAQIDALTQANHLIPGPDLYTLVSHHPSAYLLDDGIHPTPAGAAAMNNAWYLAMRGALKASAA